MKLFICTIAIAVILFNLPLSAQWVQQTLPVDINVTLGIDFINQNNGITGGWFLNTNQQVTGKEFYTFDGGNNWIQALVPDSLRVIVDVQMINNNLCYGAGAYNLSLFKAVHNVGLNSNQNSYPLQRKRYEQIGVNFSMQEDYRGYFVESTDGGVSWHPKGSLEDSVYYLVGISFLDSQTGFVIASSPGFSASAILKTNDGGNNWFYVYPFQENLKIEKIKAISNSMVIAVGEFGSSGIVLISSDGGLTWQNQSPQGLNTIYGVDYSDSLNLFIAANSFSSAAVYKTSDGGLNWQMISSHDFPPNIIEGVEVIQSSGYYLSFGGLVEFVPPKGYLLYGCFVDFSSDSGNNWNYSELSQPYLTLYSKMVDEQRWYITGSTQNFEGFVLFTGNAGGLPVELISFIAESNSSCVTLNWTTATELNNLGFEIERASSLPDGKIGSNMPGQDAWRKIGFVEGKGTTTETQNYFFTDDLFGVTDTKLYYRLKQLDFDGTYEYSDEVEVIRTPEVFSLQQNYPNPFNPTTKIEFRIADFGLVSLKVYDILGNEVAKLVNEEKPAGEYQVKFNASNLPSGIYFYQLKAVDFNQTKKMILLR